MRTVILIGLITISEAIYMVAGINIEALYAERQGVLLFLVIILLTSIVMDITDFIRNK